MDLTKENNYVKHPHIKNGSLHEWDEIIELTYVAEEGEKVVHSFVLKSTYPNAIVIDNPVFK